MESTIFAAIPSIVRYPEPFGSIIAAVLKGIRERPPEPSAPWQVAQPWVADSNRALPRIAEGKVVA